MSTASNRPVLSLVVPVRGRAYELGHLLDLLRSLPGDGIEVVVSDNSGPQFQHPPGWLADDPRFVWLRPTVPLHMAENFEFAAARARGEWLMFLGADDGLVPEAAHDFLGALAKSRTGSVTSLPTGYFWPGTATHASGRVSWISPRGERDTLTVHDSGVTLRRLRRQVLRGYRDTGLVVPRPYMLGAIRRDVVGRIRSRNTGRLFVGVIPDVYLTCAVLSVADQFESTDVNFGIQGASIHSNGLRGLDMASWLLEPDRALRVSEPGPMLLGDPHLMTNVHAQYLDVLFAASQRRRALSTVDWELLGRWGSVTGLGGRVRHELPDPEVDASSNTEPRRLPPEIWQRFSRARYSASQRLKSRKINLGQVVINGNSYWRSTGGDIADISFAASLVYAGNQLPISMARAPISRLELRGVPMLVLGRPLF